MSEDIGAGDVVVCVDGSASPEPYVGEHVVEGTYYRVLGLTEGRLSGTSEHVAGLLIFADDKANRIGWRITRFRKLNDEPDNAELIERIRKCRPVKTGVSA